MGISNGVAEQQAELVPASEEERAESEVRPKRDSAQSGVRAAPAFGARIEAALAASARTEATLSDLFRTVKFLSATIGTVRDANARLARELEELAEMLGGGARDTESERARLVSEHDKFIAMLLADHERDLEALRSRLTELEKAPLSEKA